MSIPVPWLLLIQVFQAHTSGGMGESSADISPMSPMQPDRRTPSVPPYPAFPEIRTSPLLPPLTQAGRPVRNYRLPKRYHPDPLPEPPCPAVQLENTGAPCLRINLIVRDTFKTITNNFGIWREYLHRPSYDPDSFTSITDLARPLSFVLLLLIHWLPSSICRHTRCFANPLPAVSNSAYTL